jgi:hypothetical protein
MATFCMQTLGCEVSAIHTVNYSKRLIMHAKPHTYKQRITNNPQATTSPTAASKAANRPPKKSPRSTPACKAPASTPLT